METSKTAFDRNLSELMRDFKTPAQRADALDTLAKAEKLHMKAQDYHQRVMDKTLPNWKLEFTPPGMETGGQDKSNKAHQSHQLLQRRTARIEKVKNRQLEAIKTGQYKQKERARPAVAQVQAQPTPKLQTPRLSFAKAALSPTITKQFNRGR